MMSVFFHFNRVNLRRSAVAAALLFLLFSCTGGRDGQYSLHLFTTNDVHGCYFDVPYTVDQPRPSLCAISSLVNDARKEFGRENVLLIDVGDALQGDNAAYYFNYVDTVSRHVFARMTEYMKYDAFVVGNHDIETGHSVYDRVRRNLSAPYLAANALKADGKPYFDRYVVIRRHGLRILVLGFTNANIKGWLSPELWEGMTFSSLLPFVQEEVDRVVALENPDIVVVASHSGSGRGDGLVIENQNLDLLHSLKGVDVVVGAHDHRAYCGSHEGTAYVNGGSHCRTVGHCRMDVSVKDGRVVEKSFVAALDTVDASKVDVRMKRRFARDYDKVKDFSLRKVGSLAMPLVTRDAYTGMSDYVNFIHTVCLEKSSADISFAAPLTFDGNVKAGDVVYNDLFTIYPFENQLFVVNMTGGEIRRYLEYSYEGWINTVNGGTGEGHILKIRQADDSRTGSKGWSFMNRAYNFDSAGGLVYTVDVTAPFGRRVQIRSLASGAEFCPDTVYKVAMTSYRANGGGYLLKNGAGIDTALIDERIVERGPEIRQLIYDYFTAHPSVDSALCGNEAVIGSWRFVPEMIAGQRMATDMNLLFNKVQ